MATIEFYDRVRETTTTTGTGTITLAGAVTGYRTFQSVLSTNDVTYYCIQNQSVPSEWEVGFGTLASSTTLARTSVIASSNSGSLVNFSSGTKDVFITFPAETCSSVDSGICELRLTLTSGTPVTISDVTSASTVYLTPYIGDRISLYTGNRWKLYHTSEISLSLSGLTTGKNYDIWASDNGSGGVALSLSNAWTNDTTRNQDISMVDGVYVRTSDTTLRYLGTIRTTGTTTTEDSEEKRFLWNCYNHAHKVVKKLESSSAASWTYSTGTPRPYNGDSTNIIQLVSGLGTTSLNICSSIGNSATVAGANCFTGIGEDSTSAFTSSPSIGGTTTISHLQSLHFVVPPIGYHYYCGLEQGTNTAGNVHTWYTLSLLILHGDWDC